MNKSKSLIVITGGAGGIGTACARTFKNESIVLTDYSQEAVDRAVGIFKSEGFDVTGISCDITDKKDVEKLVNFVSEQGTLKALVHTAGVSGTMQDLKKIFTIDLIATEILIDAFYKTAAEGSVAVILSSMMAHTIPPNEKYDEALRNPQNAGSLDIVSEYVKGSSDIMYNFAKRGVILLTQKNVTKWGKKGARILTVSPGVIETPMAMKASEEHPEKMEMIKRATPLQRNGKAEDVADVVNFLVSDKARFIAGSDILVDGGVIQNIRNM